MAKLLNKTESAQLMSLFDKPGWESFMKLISMRIHELEDRAAAGNTEYEYLRSSFEKDGRVAELKELFFSDNAGTTGLEHRMSE